MSHQQVYEGVEPLYRGNAYHTTERIRSSKRHRPSYGRRGKAPQSFNGIHRRRRRKLAW